MEALSPALVLYAADLAATRRFYEMLGLTFTVERHAVGPEHVACDFGGFVLEIYPRPAFMMMRNSCHHVRLVLPVENVREVARRLREHGVSVVPATIVDGLPARLCDPDGIPVVLLQR